MELLNFARERLVEEPDGDGRAVIDAYIEEPSVESWLAVQAFAKRHAEHPDWRDDWWRVSAVTGSGSLAVLEANNAETLARIADFRDSVARGDVGHSEFSRLKHEHPFIGFVPCRAQGVEFVLFHANDDLVAWDYQWGGDDHYEPDVVRTWVEWCRGASLVYDIGAYTGLMSILAAKTSPEAEVHLFEPMDRTVERAKINVRANQLGRRVHLHNRAASDVAGEARIHLYRDEDFLGTGNSLYDKESVPIRDSKVIQRVRIDDELPGLSPDVVKIDVEGHELECLRGMAETVSRARPRMVVEVWEHTRDEVLGMLAGWGYRCEPFEDPSRRVVNYACHPR